MCSCNDNDVVICSWLLLGHIIIVRRLTTTHKPISYVHASSWPMKCVSCCCHWTQHGKRQTWNVWLDCANFPQVKTWERSAQSDQKWGRSAQSDQTISTVWSNDQHSPTKLRKISTVRLKCHYQVIMLCEAQQQQQQWLVTQQSHVSLSVWIHCAHVCSG